MTVRAGRSSPAEASEGLHSALEVAVRPWPEIPAAVLAVRYDDSWVQTDTGYVLATDVIATATGRPWFGAMRELLGYERLGLRDTWMEERERPPEPMPALTPLNMRGVDVWSIHPSYDTLGGGGLASTALDLARFFSELLAGRVVSRQSLTQMQSVVPYAPGREVGLGLFRRETALGTAWGHTGVHGAFAFAIPERSITLAGSICSLDRGYDIAQPASQVVIAIAAALAGYLD